MKNKDIDYEYVEGSGKTLVFIHGWLGSKDFWKLLTPHLNLGNPMVFYNQRCHSESEFSRFDLEVLAEDLNYLVERLEIENPVLIGHSMGGMTALKYSTIYGNVSGLCLLGTSASTPEPENRSVKYFLEKFDELPREEWAEEITNNYVGKSGSEEIKEMTRNELMKANEEPVKAGLNAMIDYDVREYLEDVQIPSLVVAAEKDGAITMEKSREVAELLGCNLETVDTSHQMLPEKPEKIASLVESFVQDLP